MCRHPAYIALRRRELFMRAMPIGGATSTRIHVHRPLSPLPSSHFETKAQGIVPMSSSSPSHPTPSVDNSNTHKTGPRARGYAYWPPPSSLHLPLRKEGTGNHSRAVILFLTPHAFCS